MILCVLRNPKNRFYKSKNFQNPEEDKPVVIFEELERPVGLGLAHRHPRVLRRQLCGLGQSLKRDEIIR